MNPTDVLWVPAYVGLGSNLHDPRAQVQRGFEALSTVPKTLLIARSSLYRTPPLGPPDQPDFINAVAGLLTRLDPDELLRELKDREQQLGREPAAVRWGPRIIDFDLLVYGDRRIDAAQLRIPHPGIQARNFVLYPLAEIAPELNVPGAGPVSELLRRAAATQIQKL